MEDLMDFEDLIEDLIEQEQTTDSQDSKEDAPEAPANEDFDTDDQDDNLDQDDSEEQTEQKNNNTSEEDDSEDTEQYTAYFNFLKDYGVLAVDDDFEFTGTAESIEEALSKTKENLTYQVQKELWESLPEDFKPLLEYGLRGGKSLQDYVQAYSPINLENINLEDEENQKEIIREYYRQTTKRTDDQIEKMIIRLETLGDLETEAIDAVDYLQTFKEERKQHLLQKAEEEKERERQRAVEQINTLKSSIQTTNLDETRKRRVEAFMLAPIKEEGQVTTSFDKALNQVLNNPQHLVQLADILADYHPSKGIDLNRIETKIKTQNNKTFKQLLNESTNNSKPTGNSTKRKVKEDFDWDGFLNS